jgi:hypothetical protein
LALISRYNKVILLYNYYILFVINEKMCFIYSLRCAAGYAQNMKEPVSMINRLFPDSQAAVLILDFNRIQAKNAKF